MIRQFPSFAVALCVSLALHAALFFTLLPMYHVDSPNVARANEPTKEMTVVMEAIEPEPKDDFQMGDAAGRGYASHDAPAEKESVAPEAETDQAYLSLDPQGTGGSGSDPAVVRAAGKGSARGQPRGAPPTLVTESVAPDAPTQSLTPFGLNSESKTPKLVPKVPPRPVDVVVQAASSPKDAGAEDVARPVTAPPHPVPPTPPAPPQPDAIAVNTNPQPTPSPSPATADGGFAVDGSQQPAADPARMSDSESDPFSRLGTAVFVDGDWRVRFGRKVKTRKPRLLLAGTDALLGLNRARISLRIDIDATGKVTGVKITKSSGSNDIDQPTRVAVYDWWFEPKKDADGQPVPDQIEFTLAWR